MLGTVPNAENAEQAQGPCSPGAYLHASGVDGNKPVNKETRSFWMMTGAIYTKNKAESHDEQSGPTAILREAEIWGKSILDRGNSKDKTSETARRMEVRCKEEISVELEDGREAPRRRWLGQRS